MGAAHGINVATLDAFQRGVLRSANVITTGTWVPEALRLHIELTNLREVRKRP